MDEGKIHLNWAQIHGRFSLGYEVVGLLVNFEETELMLITFYDVWNVEFNA